MGNPRFFGTATMDLDQRDVLILSPYIATSENAKSHEIDFEHSLVVDLNGVNFDIAEQLTDMANSADAANSPLLMVYLSNRSFRNSDRVLAWLHTTGNISKVQSKDVIVQAGNESITLSQLNSMIKENMKKKELSEGMDPEQYHRERAQDYKKQLDPYPDFGNPSDNGDVKVSDIDPELAKKYDLPIEDRNEGEHVENTESNDPEVIKNAKEAIVATHQKIMDEIGSVSNAVTESMDRLSELKGTLSENMVSGLMGDLINYGSTAGEDVKNALIETLASHYDHVDVDYIKRNLDAAEKRKAKEAKESK